MRILNLNLKEAVAELVPESIDDLWHLVNIVRPGDLVGAKTSRTIKIRGSMGEVEGRSKVALSIKLRVEAVQLDLYVKRLKIYGVVEDSKGVEGLKGRHHSINLKVGEPILLLKDKWLPNELERLERAKLTESRSLVVVSVDRDECCIAIIGEHGLDIKAEIPIRLPGKRDSEQWESSVRKNLKVISEALGRLDIGREAFILVVGPGFLYEKLAEHLNQEPQFKGRVKTGKVSIGGVSGVYEALRSGLIANYLGEIRLIYEAKLLDEVFKTLSEKPNMVTYGIKPIKDLASTGAIKTLLVSERLLKNLPDGELDELLKAIREVEQRKGEVVFISSGLENDRILGLGGIVAILRYPIA
ncbi:MAG: mRNA surveillance protein pelota [Candidatus Bathyarchaeia archaeon]